MKKFVTDEAIEIYKQAINYFFDILESHDVYYIAQCNFDVGGLL